MIYFVHIYNTNINNTYLVLNTLYDVIENENTEYDYNSMFKIRVNLRNAKTNCYLKRI